MTKNIAVLAVMGVLTGFAAIQPIAADPAGDAEAVRAARAKTRSRRPFLPSRRSASPVTSRWCA